jgi:hypothetical protein
MPPTRTASDHEAGDVLEEEKRNPALRADLDEVRPLSALSEKRTPLFATIPTG